MIPDGWQREPLMNVAKIQTGIAKGKQGLKDPVEVPYLRVANVQDGHLNLSEIKTLLVERTKIERFSLKAGDVLMTEGGDFDKLGRGDVWQGQIDPCLHQNHVFCVRPNIERITPYFLSSLSGSNYGKYYFLSCAKRSTNLASINSTQLKEFPVLIPPLPEQKKIAQILSTWDKAIETVEKLIANSQQKKKALMQQLLTGKKRFAGFDGEWKEMRLKDCADSLDNKRIPLNSEQRSAMKGSIPYWGANGIVDYVNDYILNEAVVLLAEDGGYFNEFSNREIANISYGKAWVNNHAHILKAKVNSINEWLYYSLVHKNILGFINGGTRAKLNKSDMLLIPMLLPPIEEQQKIASVLSTADQEIETWQQELAHLKQEKKALMQQLLTGKRRVKVDNP